MAPITVEVPVPVKEPIPEDLLVDCYIPEYREGQPRSDFYDYAGKLLKSLQDCNMIKASHRDTKSK